MDRTLRALAIAALVCLGVAFFGFQSPTVITSGSGSSAVIIEVLGQTGSSLAFAAGVAALVVMAQRRQWRWFAALLLLVVIQTYGLSLLFLTGLGFRLMDAMDHGVTGGYQFTLLSSVGFAFMAPLAVLIYSRPRRAATVRDPDIEYSSLRNIEPTVSGD